MGKNKIRLYGFYTVGFLLFVVLIVFFPLVNHHSFIRVEDGWNQDYPIFLYYGKQLRRFVHTGQFSFYDFSIGLGGDMISTLNHNGFGDPLNLLSFFAVGEAAMYLYAFVLFLRMYLAGAGMLLYCDRHGRKGSLCILAGLLYAFSLFVLTWGTQFFQTLNATYLLPPLLLCLETLLREDEKKGAIASGVAFALLIAVQACCSFYFLYMQTLILFCYALVDYLTRNAKNWLGLIRKVVYVASFYLLGIMISGIVLFPVIGGFLQSGRVAAGIGGKWFLLWQPENFLYRFADLFVPMTSSLSTASLGLSLLSMFAILFFCTSRNIKERTLAFLLLFAYLCPIVWSVFNGFSYPIARWMFVIFFAVIYGTILTIERMSEPGEGKWIWILGSTLFVVSLTLHFCLYGDKIRTFFYSMISLVLLYIIKHTVMDKIRALTWLCIVNLVVNIVFIVAPYQICGQQMWKSFCSAADVRQITDKMAEAETEPELSDWYRVDLRGDSCAESIIQGYKGCENYYSLMNKAIWSVYDAMMISPGIYGATHSLFGLDGCLALESLLSVRYYEEDNQIKKNEYSLPFGVEYTETVSEETFFEMEPLDRRDIVSRKIVLPNTTGEQQRAEESCFVELPCTVQYRNIEIGDGVLIPGDNAEILVDIEGELPDSKQGELYLYFENFYTQQAFESQTVTIGSKCLYVYNPENEYSVEAGQRSALVKMDDVKRNYVVQLPQDDRIAPLYVLDNVRVYWYPTGETKEALEKLKAHSMKNLRWSNDMIEGDIAADGGYLFFSIPYNNSWKVYVDGRQVQTFRANIGFMAVSMDEGNHHVKIVYEPLLQKLGTAATLLGIMIALGLPIWDRRRRRLRESSLGDILM